MAQLNFKVLTANRYKNKFFGVDYFANLCDGSHHTFKYFSSSVDELAIFKDEMVSLSKLKLEIFKTEISNLESGKIIGIFQNPDLYDTIDSIKFIIEELEKYGLGLFLETNSEKIIDDINVLSEFSKKFPLLIAIPISTFNDMKFKIFGKNTSLDACSKLLQKLIDADLNVGIILKPIIPKINDDIEDLERIIDKAHSLNIKYIYPSFTLHFDSFKLKNFYDIIEKEKPELKNYYFDKFGYKYSWESDNLSELKKTLVFNSKKRDIKYAMKDIINLYRDDSYIQLKLF